MVYWSSSMQGSPNLHFQDILQVDLRWPLTLICDLLTAWTYEGSHIISINKVWFKSDFQLFKWGHFHIFCLSYNLQQMTFDLGMWSLTAWTYEGFHIISNKPSLVPIRLQLFKWGHFLHFQPILQLDLRWPLTLICDLWPHQQMRFPCCIYDPTLVELHQSMWKLEPNVNLFSQHQQTTTTSTNNRWQSDQCVFPAKAEDTKRIIVHKITWNNQFHVEI